MLWKDPKGYGELPLSSKIGLSLFLVLAGIGYLLGFVNILLSYSPVDQQPGMSIEDIRISFYGAREMTALESSIDGAMRQYFASDKNYEVTKDWLAAGATEDAFVESIKPIFDTSCSTCHSQAAQVADVVTETYADVEEHLVQDTGKSVGRLVSLTHTHLLATLVLVFILAMIFGGTRFSEKIKVIFITLSFGAIFLDLGSWWLAKLSGAMAPLVIVGGVSLGFSFAVLVLLSLYDIWLAKTK
jgi:hypothetical protein